MELKKKGPSLAFCSIVLNIVITGTVRKENTRFFPMNV